MIVLNMFSVVYFVWVIVAIVLMVIMYRVFRDKSDRFKYNFLFSLTILAWIIHFSRIWLDPDLLPHKIFFEDLCGFSTMVYPFFFLSKNKVLKDYMYFVGAVFAAHSLFYPNNIEGDPIFYFNTIRFFFAHFILVSVPVMMVSWKMHVPSIKHIPYMVLFVLIGALYNFSLSAFFVEVGLLSYYKNYMGLWANTDSVFRIFERVAPFAVYTTIEQGVEVTKPIPFVYMIPGLILFYTPVWTIMSIPFLRKKQTT
jgi:hypothetical protein